MDEDIQTVKRIILKLRKEFGNIININEVVSLSVEENISRKDVMKAIETLETEGIIIYIDKDTIEVTG